MLIEEKTGRKFRVAEVRTRANTVTGERRSFVTLVNVDDPTMIANSVNEEDLQDWFHAWGIAAHNGRFADDRIQDLEYHLRQRREDCAKVREALIPLLEHEFPYSLDIRGDTTRLRAGFVAKVAGERIEHQADEIERLGKMVDSLKAEVSSRSGITLKLQQDLELMQRQRDEARADANHYRDMASGGGETARDW